MKHVALLRGINVGGRNKLPMAELREMFITAGGRSVETYIQSGNVVFEAPGRVLASLPSVVAAAIEERIGSRIPVVIRSAVEITQAASQNPFAGAEPKELHVYFLKNDPNPAAVAGLDAGRSRPDEFVVRGCEIYLKLPNGTGRTKLTNAYFDSKLKTVSTARNWKTVQTLAEMASR